MARWVSVAVTTTDHTIFNRSKQGESPIPTPEGAPFKLRLGGDFLGVTARLEELAAERSRKDYQLSHDR